MACDGDPAGAEREFRRAIELNPGYASAHHWYGHNLMAMGRLEEALAELTRAQELDSRSLVIAAGIGWNHYYGGEYNRAIQQCRKALEQDPSFVLLICVLGLAYAQTKRTAEAITAFQKALSLAPANPFTLAGLGYACAVSGDAKVARKHLASLRAKAKKQYVPAILFAFLHAGLREKDAAFQWLERASDERSDYMLYLKIVPAFA